MSTLTFGMHHLRAIAIAAILAVAAAPLAAQDSGIDIGKHAPPIALNDADGKAVSLSDVIGKKPVLLEFWATWCPQCKELEPRMFDAYKKYGAQIAFYGIAVPINESLEGVKRYVVKYKYPYPVLWDVKGLVAEQYEVPATSYVVVIDKTGKVVYTGQGGTQNLDAAIKKAM